MACWFFIRTVFLFSLVTFQLNSAATCEAGGPQTAQNMQSSGTWANIFYHYRFKCFGKVTKWIFYAKSTKTLFADAWRETNDGKLELIGSNRIEVTTTGEQTYDVPANEQFQVQPNDMIGLHYLSAGDNNGVVPFDNELRPPFTEGVTAGDDFSNVVTIAPGAIDIGDQVNLFLNGRKSAALKAVISVTACEAGGPQTALAMDTSRGTNGNIYYDNKFNCAGTVTKWTFYAKNAKIFVADAWRETEDGKLTLIGSNQISVTTLGDQSYDVPTNEQFEVQANDMIGLHYLERGDNACVVPWDDKEYESGWTDGITSDDFSDVVNIGDQGVYPIGKKVDNNPTKERSFALRVMVNATDADSK